MEEFDLHYHRQIRPGREQRVIRNKKLSESFQALWSVFNRHQQNIKTNENEAFKECSLLP